VIPSAARFVIVGAGVHGLSTAIHLSDELGGGDGIVVLEKRHVGAGASGISGGIVRNFYLSAAMNELVRQSVEIFELDPSLFGFRQVGYVAAVGEEQRSELERIAAQHEAVGYPSVLRTGAEAIDHLRTLFPDWRAEGVAAVLHEERSGWADAATTLAALTGMARSAGVSIAEGVEVTGFSSSADSIESVVTSGGTIDCEAVVLAPGPWVRDLWRLLELPDELGGKPSFHYWGVQEGEHVNTAATLDPFAPVVHLDLYGPLCDRGGTALHPGPWGIYFRPSLAGGITGGGLPYLLEVECELDPYGPSNAVHGRGDARQAAQFTVGLETALGRFDDGAWRSECFRAPMCFTPDSYPLVGWVHANVYALLDSNHGFKLLALGRLAAHELAGGTAPELDPFRLERFATKALHPVSASPYPWT
jgi:glycine/D-amino acid oxidase-like deaminating enzyme